MAAAIFEITDDGPVERALGELHALIVRHPVAAQALFRAFVAEGRAFAGTAEGARWMEQLRRSDLVRQGRVVWDTVSLNALDDREENVFPSAILDAFARALVSTDMHALLARVIDGSVLGSGADAG